MAKVTFGIVMDMRTFAGYDNAAQRSQGGGGTTGDTSYSWDWSSGYHEDITGTGFGTGGFTTYPSMGTVTGWNFGFTDHTFDPSHPFDPIIIDHPYWDFSGLSVPAADFSNAISGDGATLAAYMPTMLDGNDKVFGSAFDDFLLGYNGNDSLYGNLGNDTLQGGSGNDLLNGGLGDDTMRGGFGSDTYVVDSVHDKVFEDAVDGLDLVKSSVSFTLGSDVERLTLTGSAAIDGTGNTQVNLITGNGGANVLKGLAGNDTLNGGGGGDTLAGGSGNDILTGGTGQDLFQFSSMLDAATNVDKIKDFSVADDTITLARNAFGAFTATGTLDAAAFHNGSSAADADDRIIYNSTTGNIYYDDDGTGADAQILFAHVTAGTALTNADFLVV